MLKKGLNIKKHGIVDSNIYAFKVIKRLQEYIFIHPK